MSPISAPTEVEWVKEHQKRGYLLINNVPVKIPRRLRRLYRTRYPDLR